MNRSRLLATMLILLIAGGCVSEPEPSSGIPPAITDLEDRLATDGITTFRSWNGRKLGTDCDTEITLREDGTASMREYGYQLSVYRGTWRIDEQGVVTCEFPRFEEGWPAMRLAKDEMSLRLDASDGPRFVMGNRGGASIPADAGAFWPFRPVSAAEEEALREKHRESDTRFVPSSEYRTVTE